MRFEGLFPALVTPFHRDHSLDLTSLRRLVERLVAGKNIAGLVCNANAGEVWALSDQEQVSILQEVRQVTGPTFPLAAGLVAPSLEEAKRRLSLLQESGADAVLAFPMPEWFVGVDPEVPLKYFTSLNAESSIPFILFQFPAKAGAAYSAEVLAQLVTVPQVKAVKQAVWDMNRFSAEVRAMRKARPDVKILSGVDEYVFESLCVGVDGMLLAAGCLLSDFLVGMSTAVSENNLPAARAIADRITPILHQLYGVQPFARRHARLKSCLRTLGVLEEATMRPPAVTVEAPDEALMIQLHDLGLYSA